ncbi:MAG: ribosome maturation factor RimP [Mycobacteriales bacterium]
MATGDAVTRLSALLEPAVVGVGFDLEGISVARVGARSVLRVVIDRDGGVDLDGVAQASRTIAAVLDEADPLTTPYVLEVTSPGVERPLTAPRHWRRARGRLIRVSGPGLRLTGRVVDADDTSAVLDVAGARRRLPYSEVTRAVVQVEFREAGP